MKKKPRILFYDIETSPLLSYTWGTYDQNVITVEEDWELLSVGYRWKGQKKVSCIARPDFRDKTDKSLTKALWDLHNEADVVVAHNGDKFDNKKANAKFIQHGLPAPAPYASVDTLKVAKKHFRFTSNRLDDLGKRLGLGRKVQTGGHKLWLDCMAGCPKAWKKMIKYNKQDVVLLEKVYGKLLGWIDNHPNVARLMDKPFGCPNCGSSRLFSHGWRHTKTNSYRRFKCRECGYSPRSRFADPNVTKPEVV